MAEGGVGVTSDDTRLCWCMDFGTSDSGKPTSDMRQTRFFVQCCRYFCGGCLLKHNRPTGMAAHRLVIRDPEPRRQERTMSYKCQAHGDRLLEIYCPGHDVVCCYDCTIHVHRLCEDLQYITSVAGTFRQIPTYTDLVADAKYVMKTLKILLEAKQNDKGRLSSDWDDTCGALNSSAAELRDIVDGLTAVTMANATEQHSRLEKDVDFIIVSLDETIAELEKQINEVEMSDGNSECSVFVQFNSLKHAYQNGKEKVRRFSGITESQRIDFKVNTNIKESLAHYQSLGHINNDIQLGLEKFRATVRVQRTTEAIACNITGICQLQNGRIILADWANKELVKVDSAFNFKDAYRLPVPPFDVCATGSTAIATTLVYHKQIMMLSVGQKIRFERTFSVGDLCRGITCIHGLLYICCSVDNEENPGFIKVFDLNGTPIQKLQYNLAGHHIFSVPKYIAFDTESSLVYVSDSNKGLVVTDTQGKISTVIADANLSGPSGVCVTNKHQVVVCGCRSHNILQIGPGHRDKYTLVFPSSQTPLPQAVCYDRRKSRLMATFGGDDDIYLFDFS